MSMIISPDSGHVLPISEARKVLNGCVDTRIPNYAKLLDKFNSDDGDADDYVMILNRFLRARGANTVPLAQGAFRADDEQAPELVNGEWYFIFDDCDLFTRTETKAHKDLQRLGFKPQLEHWTNFG